MTRQLTGQIGRNVALLRHAFAPSRHGGHWRRAALVTLAVVVAVSGCASDAAVEAPSPTASSIVDGCLAVMAALPASVDGLSRTAGGGTFWRQWGAPAVTLRCGVAKPAALGPTSRCDVVNGVGWFSVEGKRAWTFTTIGRAGYLEVTVPHDHAPEADVLVDLSAAVQKLPEVSPCR